MKKLELGSKIKVDVKVFNQGKIIKQLTKRNFLMTLGKNQIAPDVDDKIIQAGWMEKYTISHLFQNTNDPDIEGKTLNIEIFNLTFKKRYSKKENKEQQKIDNLNTEIENLTKINKQLNEKFVVLEEINQDLKEKVRELSNKIAENKRITVPEDEIKKIRQYALQKFFEEFSNPYSTLKAAIASGVNTPDNNVKTYVKGFEMVLSMVENVFGSHGLKIVKPNIGDAFDPNSQKAIDFVIDNDKEANTIVKVNSDAYMLFDRVIKPAIVVLSKKEQ
ncbi:nucleotide exchange factor GrpE [Mycoplasma sp. CSL7475-4]|uniref:nucleotide exchange factor GrpE n=1 Tax=Mycoplasma sp. CSL7475-4 TaxID=2973942 RepID=UPI00216AFE23|nr:nucleotide exchange factor GrpE [Mycoplasma sp. CSL7475-4]MCS4536913.1 nucleotide exchange factor GrpE [Mycoplasma sp. CSL7475-4]